MKRVLIAMVIGLGLLLFLQASGAETIKIGYFINKPFIYLNETSGKPQGPKVRFVEAIAAKMGYAVEWVGPLPLIRYATYLQEGTVDVGASVVMLPEIQEIVYYSAQPTDLVQAVFIVRKENPLTKISSIQDVEGYRVGWFANMPPSQFVQDNLTHLQMDYMPPSDNMDSQSLHKLLLNRVDALHQLNAYSLPFIAAELHLLDQIKVLPLPEPPMPVYIGFSKKSPRGKMLMEQYNAAQAEIGMGPEEYTKFIQQEFDAIPNP
jgi:ABC-type amino acid transport substrate-binding protein